jgi:hypothetical protein
MTGRPWTRRGSPALLLTVILAVVTATALLGAGFALSEPATAGPESAAGARLVARFYAAVDAAIAKGDSTDLLAVLAPGFTFHLESPGGDRARFAAGILALHAAAPDLRLTAEEVIAGRERAVARVAVDGDAAGVPIPDPAARPRPLDTFRFAGGTIAEYDGVAGDLRPSRPVLRSTVGVPAGPLLVGVARLVLAPGARLPLQRSRGASLFIVEIGCVDLGVGGVERSVFAGESEAVSEGQTYALRNAGSEGATVLAVGLMPVDAATQSRVRNDEMAATLPMGVSMFLPFADGANGSPAWPAGIERVAFAGGPGPTGASGGTDVALVRQSLAPGFCVPAAGLPAIVGVEAGLVAATGGATADTSVWGAGTIAAMPAGTDGVCNAGRAVAVVVIGTFVAANAPEW